MRIFIKSIKKAVLTSLFFIGGVILVQAQSACVAQFQHQPIAGTTSVSFLDSSIAFGTGPITSWSWDFGDGNTSTLQNPTHNYNSSGWYLVCLTITTTNPQCTSTYCDTIVAGSGNPNCSAYFTWNQNSTAPVINFTNQSVGPYVYWDFGDGTTSSNPNPVHTYANPGSYNVCITVIDSSINCVDTYCQNIIVSGASSCIPTFSYNIGTNGQVAFNGSASGIITVSNWTWSFGDGSTGTGQNPIHTYTSSGLYLVCLTINSINPQCSGTYCDSIFVQVGTGGNCAANFSWSQNTLPPVINFTNLSTGNYTSLSWSFGDGTGSSSPNPVHTYANPGTYIVCLTISDSLSCTNTFCDTIVVTGTGTGNCQSAFTYTADSTNTIFQFLNNSTGMNLTYFWDFGDGSTSTAQNPQHTYATSGIYGACLTVSNGTCTSYSCDTLYVGSTSSCSAYFVWNANVIGGVQFNSYSAGAQLTYSWDFGDGTTSNQQNPLHVYANSGTYTACLTITDILTGCTDTYCNVVTVQVGGGNCSSNYAIYPDTTIAHNYIAYNLATGVAPLTYLWSWGDSTFSNTAYPSHTYAGPGMYQICLTITDATGCTSTTCYQWSLLRLQGGAPVTINVIQGTTGINEAELNGTLMVYPNPASDLLNIELSNLTGEPAIIELYSLDGRLVKELGSHLEPTTKLSINLDDTQAGIYILKVVAGEWFKYQKIVVN